MGKKWTHNCIYCTKQRPLTKEHIVPECLGGTVWRHLVCDGCRFSHLDQALAERSHISIDRVGRTPSKALTAVLGATTFQYDEKLDLYLDSFVGNGVVPHPLPQLHFRNRGDGTFALIKWARDEEDFEKVLNFIEAHAQRGSVSDISFIEGPAELCTTTRIFVDLSGRGFIRAKDASEAKVVLAKLEASWYRGLRVSITGGTPELRSDDVDAVLRPSIDLDTAMRGVAKIAFNFTAMEFGAELVLQTEFDRIREYILDDAPYSYDRVALAYDCRFVALWMAERDSPWTHHVLAVRHSKGRLQAIVILYGFVHTVELGPLSLDRFACRRFSIAREGATALSLSELEAALGVAGVPIENLDNVEWRIADQPS